MTIVLSDVAKFISARLINELSSVKNIADGSVASNDLLQSHIDEAIYKICLVVSPKTLISNDAVNDSILRYIDAVNFIKANHNNTIDNELYTAVLYYVASQLSNQPDRKSLFDLEAQKAIGFYIKNTNAITSNNTATGINSMLRLLAIFEASIDAISFIQSDFNSNQYIIHAEQYAQIILDNKSKIDLVSSLSQQINTIGLLETPNNPKITALYNISAGINAIYADLIANYSNILNAKDNADSVHTDKVDFDQKYTDFTNKYTDTTTKYTDIVTKYNTLIADYNDFITKYTDINPKVTDLWNIRAILQDIDADLHLGYSNILHAKENSDLAFGYQTSAESARDIAVGAKADALTVQSNVSNIYNANASFVGLQFGAFSMVDGELIISHLSTATPSLVDGELILIYEVI